jgi:UDP:flavonoid glycosyltransferase YjiC (YdhE family)
LSNPSYRNRAREIGAALKAAGGQNKAASLIEMLVGKATPAMPAV